ncbi:VanZ family protein [Aurantibacter crassamenti]|uniref:VanZ family protein n=1 Tax=Aurantibacter crassamenti TaxID=1837375 RepID=UPI0019392D57|nr:VanZ family protein [Aurantibacter crassamenti]MBM1105993.1 VanZ family protein [Aurantibacter crassamenti]
MLTKSLWVPKKPFFTIAFFIWLVFVTYSSLASFSGIDTDSYSFNIPYADKIVHFIFYSTAAFLGVFSLREQKKWSVSKRKSFVLLFVFTVIFGIIIEVIQYKFTTNREGDILDALANSLGGLIGVLVCNFIFSNKGLLKWDT